MAFEDLLNQHQVEQTAIAQQRALQQAHEATRGQEEQAKHNETWQLVAAVRDKLVDENIAPDAQILQADKIEEYNQRRRNAEYANPIFRGMTRMKARKASFAEDNTVDGWSLDNGMYVGSDGIVYDMRKRGLTKEEKEVGVLLGAPKTSREKLKKQQEYDLIQKGLAALVSKSGVQWP